MYKTKQQRAILVLALVGIQHLQGRSKPEKKRVLNFIRIKNLYKMPAHENEKVSNNEKAWENRFAWLRSDLHSEGIIAYNERDCWELTSKGFDIFVEWLGRLRGFIQETPKWREELASNSDPISDFYFSENAIELALIIGEEKNI